MISDLMEQRIYYRQFSLENLIAFLLSIVIKIHVLDFDSFNKGFLYRNIV